MADPQTDRKKLDDALVDERRRRLVRKAIEREEKSKLAEKPPELVVKKVSLVTRRKPGNF